MSTNLYQCLCLAVCVVAVLGTPKGAPASVCDSMKPDHGVSNADDANFPYEITFSKNTYSPNEKITVTLSKTGATGFKGFFIQARKSAATYTLYGSMEASAGVQLRNCIGQNTAVTHTIDDVKDSISFTWTAPGSNEGDIIFVYTVVQVAQTYWVKRQTSALTYQDPPAPTTISRDSGCGTTVGCFSDSLTCTTDCNFLVTWKPHESDDIEFTMKRKTTTANQYIAVGFSSDKIMGSDSALLCVSNNSVVTIASSTNTDYKSNMKATDPMYGITLVDSSSANGILSCTIRRKLTSALAGSSSPDAGQFNDLNNEWFLFVASGDASSGTISKHSTVPKISPEKVDFQSFTNIGNIQDQTTEQQTTTTQQSPSTPSTISRDSGCGTTVGCFSDSLTCTTNCNFLVTWKPHGSDDIEFTMKRKTTSADQYIAVGFSDDPKMGGDSVLLCVTKSNVAAIFSGYNVVDSKWNKKLTNPMYGISLVASSTANGVLSCTIKRKLTSTLAEAMVGGRRKRETDAEMFFDLNNDWFMFVALGNADDGSISQHTSQPSITPQKIDFQSFTDIGQNQEPAGSNDGVITKDKGCGDSVGCYSDCDGDKCSFLLTWKEQGDNIDLTLACKKGSTYCAIGLSSDEKMGDDSVFACTSSGGKVDVSASYNKKGAKGNDILSDPKFGITLKSASLKDGVLSCAFSRSKTAALVSSSTTRRRKRAVSADAATFFDMNSDWNLLFAYGSSIGGTLSKHSTTPVVSSQKADFQGTIDIGATNVKRPLVKVHGILMTVAWMLLAPIGIFMARFYKNVWPEGKEWCKLKRWFVIHRICMVLAFLCTAAAFVIIFVDVGGFSQIVDENIIKSHPIIGIVVMGLALTNPIMAAGRPAPDASNRPIFNIGHLFVGGSAQVLGVLNLFTGTYLASGGSPEFTRIILYVFVGWVVFVLLISHFYSCASSKGKSAGQGTVASLSDKPAVVGVSVIGVPEDKESKYEMKNFANVNEPAAEKQPQPPRKQEVSTFRLVILGLHVVVVLGLSAAIIIIVALGENTI